MPLIPETIAFMLKNNAPATWLFNIAVFMTIVGGIALILGGAFAHPGMVSALESPVPGAVLVTLGFSGLSIGIALFLTYLVVAAIVVGVTRAIAEAIRSE
ncbi:hypothetical protein GCM10009693_07920 [Leucobacter chromiireducens subsp. chromiireducens]